MSKHLIEWLSANRVVTVEIGKGLSMTVELDRVPEAQFAGILMNGLKNQLGDKHANITTDSIKAKYPNASEADVAKLWRDESIAATQKKLDAIYAGQSRTASTRVSTANPIEAEAMRLARLAVYKATDKWEKGDKTAWARIQNSAKALGIEAPKGKHEGPARNEFAKRVISASIKAFAALPETVKTATANVEATKSLVPSGDIAAALGLDGGTA